MGDGGRKVGPCPVCGVRFKNIWWHILRNPDQPHSAWAETTRSKVQDAFPTLNTAEQVAEDFPFTAAVVSAMWRDTFGHTATRERQNRLQRRAPRFCARPGCVEALGLWAKIYCSPACANSVSGANPAVRQKKQAALQGQRKTESHKQRLSATFKQKAAEGTLPVQDPQVRAKMAATKQAQGAAGTVHAVAGYMASTTPQERAQRGANLKNILQAKYGVSHAYSVPGVGERANRAKSEAMARRIAAGIPTNDWGRYVRGWHDSPVAGRQWFQSGWERVRMEVLDAAGVGWTKKHGIRIPYTDGEGGSRYYIPDFQVWVGETCLVEEVKGWDGINLRLKVEAAQGWCASRGWTFCLLDTPDLIRCTPGTNVVSPAYTGEGDQP